MGERINKQYYAEQLMICAEYSSYSMTCQRQFVLHPLPISTNESFPDMTTQYPGPRDHLITWNNFNPGMDKYYNTHSTQKSPVQHKNTRFDTKMPGSTEKCPTQHASAAIAIINPTFFFNFIQISCF